MNLQLLKSLAKSAKQDGLTLQWSLVHLIERLERNQQTIAHQHQRDQRAGDTSAQQLQLENEALALILTSVMQAYPAGKDIDIEP